MRYEIHWSAWDGDRSEVIDADSEEQALNVAEQRWHKARENEPIEINAFLVDEQSDVEG